MEYITKPTKFRHKKTGREIILQAGAGYNPKTWQSIGEISKSAPKPTPIEVPTGQAAIGKQVRIGGTLYPSQEWYDVNVAKKTTTAPTPTTFRERQQGESTVDYIVAKQKATGEGAKPTPTTPTLETKVGTDKSTQDDILNWVGGQKPLYGTSGFGFDNREQMIEQGVATYGEGYRQFIVDTIYRELREKEEPAYEPPAYDVYKGYERLDKGANTGVFEDRDDPGHYMKIENGKLIRTDKDGNPIKLESFDLGLEPIDLGIEEEEEPAVVTSDEEKEEKDEEVDKEEEDAKEIKDDQTEIAKLTAKQQLKNLREELGLPEIDSETGLEKPALPTYKSDFEALRDEHGIEAIETRLTALNKQISDTEASLRQGLYDVEGELKPMELIGTEQRELTRKGQEALDTLNRSKAVLVDEYNTKANLVNTMMNLKQMDYNAARDDYNTQFNQQIQLLNIIEGRMTQADKEKNQQQDDARANLTILTNLSKGTTWDELDPNIQTQIQNLEMKAGLPTGFTEQVLASVNPEKNIKTTIVSTDKTKVSIVYDDGTVETFSTGLTAEEEEYKAPTTKKFGDRWYQWDTSTGEWVDMGVEKGEVEFTSQEERKLEQAGLLGVSRQEQLNYLYGDKEEPLELGKDILRKLAIAGVPPDIAQGIFQDLKSGYSLNEIRQNLASQFGKEKGFGYLDKTMPILEKAQEGIKVITM